MPMKNKLTKKEKKKLEMSRKEQLQNDIVYIDNESYVGYSEKAPRFAWGVLGKHLKDRTEELDELRIRTRELEWQIALLRYLDARESLTPEERRLASMTYWRIPVEYVDTPFYAKAYEILAEDPAQVCMMDEVVKKLEKGKTYHMTVHVISSEKKDGAYEAVIEDPYFKGGVSSEVNLSRYVGKLVYVGFHVTDDGIVLTKAKPSPVPYKKGLETISFTREKGLPYGVNEAWVHVFTDVPNAFGKIVGMARDFAHVLCQYTGDVIEEEYVSRFFEFLFEDRERSILWYILDSEGFKEKNLVTEKVHSGDLTWNFVEKHIGEIRRTYRIFYPEYQLNHYTEARVFEEVGAGVAFLHGVHLGKDGKIYVTRELRGYHDGDRIENKWMVPVRFSMELSNEKFMR